VSELELANSIGKAKPPLWRRGWFLVAIALGLVAASLLVQFGVLAFIAQPVKYEGTSMEPALKNGDRLMIQKRLGELKRGDIVAFYYPNDTSKTFVKRIIALPGETISTDTLGVVFINNSEIQEPYVSPDRNRGNRQFPESRLGPDEYFVMGDNRDTSNDSRFFGPVPRRLIYGKVMGRYWPISR